MARNKRRSYKPRSQSNTRKHPKQRPALVVPKEFSEGIVLFDEDEFYGIFLGLLLGSLNQASLLHILTQTDFESFKKVVQPGKFSKNIYIIDELFGWGKIDIPNLVKNLRIIDSEAHIIGCTAVGDAEISNRDIYDTVVVKGKSNNDNSMARALAEILGVELQVDNSDPEYQ